jgi:hypothetical protein
MNDIEHVYLVGTADGEWHDVATPQAFKTYRAARDSINETIYKHHAGNLIASSENPGFSYSVVIKDIDNSERMIVGFWLRRVQVLSK